MFWRVIFTSILVHGLSGCAEGCGGDDGFGSSDDDDTSGGVEEPDDWVPNGELGPDWSVPVRVDAVQGGTPDLLIEDAETAYVFYSDLWEPDGDHGSLYVRTIEGDALTLSEPVEIVTDAYTPRPVLVGSEVHLMANQMYQTLYLIGSDGASTWEAVDGVANTNSGGCFEALPSRLAFTPQGDTLLALGYVDHNAVIGCVDKARISWLEDGEWSEPMAVGSHQPAGIVFWSDDQVLYPTSFALYRSEDGGETFTEHPSGDTSQERICGIEMNVLDDGTVLLVRAYNYAMNNHLVLARGKPDTGQWEYAWVRLQETENSIQDAAIARHGDTLVVAWLEARSGEIIDAYSRLEGFSRVSHDLGATWSEESQLTVSVTGEQIGDLALAVGEGRVLSAYTLTRATGDQEVHLVDAPTDP